MFSIEPINFKVSFILFTKKKKEKGGSMQLCLITNSLHDYQVSGLKVQGFS